MAVSKYYVYEVTCQELLISLEIHTSLCLKVVVVMMMMIVVIIVIVVVIVELPAY